MKIFSVLLDNRPGALDRITGLIRRCGWNIQDITASQTGEPGVTRVTMSVMSKGMPDETFKGRFKDLDCVKSISIYSPGTHVLREMMLVRMSVEEASKMNLVGSSNKISEQNGICVYEFCGSTEEIDELVKSLPEDVRYCRTGGMIIDK